MSGDATEGEGSTMSTMTTMCARCVLTTRIPGVTLDGEGVCSVCREYEANRAAHDGYFRTEDDLWCLLDAVRAAAASQHDVALMYSGGKDSTYVLCRLIERGYRVLAITFDNGYVPRACFDNIARVCARAGVESIVLSLERGAMNRVFQISLRRDADVCSGCYRALTAKGTEVAHERGIPVVMTGLSRGQIFETKVHPLVEGGVTAPDDIDRCLSDLRALYHARTDEVGRLIGDQELARRRALDALQFVDFFRYSAASKQEIVSLIAARLPFWTKPDNVGSCSSNCMINDVGIAEHLRVRGYHSYAVAASWDIRFGHETRAQALRDFDEPLDRERIRRILRVLGESSP